jgi:hypothetical protein
MVKPFKLLYTASLNRMPLSYLRLSARGSLKTVSEVSITEVSEKTRRLTPRFFLLSLPTWSPRSALWGCAESNHQIHVGYKS